MKNAKTTRKALLTSVVALVICVTMLMGTTFAWFTDTAKVTVNKITAGTLTIEVKDAETKTALTELKFENSKGETAILWEPGATFKTNAFYVENTGNLALKFKVVVSGIEGDAGLLKVIDFKLVEEGSDTPTNEVHLGVDDNNKTSANYYITGTMDANADNDYQGLTLTGIEINIYATQDTVEYDSETNQYDVNAEYYNTYKVDSVDEFNDALNKSESGDVIALGNDLTLDSLTQSGDKEVTVDLAGNTLTLGSTENPSDGLIAEDGAVINLINSGDEKTVIKYVGNHTYYDAIYVDGNSTLNMGNGIDLVVSPTASSAIHADNGSVVNIGEGANIIVDGTTENQFTAIYISDGSTVNMTGGSITINCVLDENNGYNNDAVGVMLLGDNTKFNMTGGTITVNGTNTFTQAVQISTMNGSANPSQIYINGGTLNVNGGSEVCAFAIYDPTQGTIVIENATFTGKYDSAVSLYYSGNPDITITGGSYTFDPSAYVDTNAYTVTVDNGVWTVTAK